MIDKRLINIKNLLRILISVLVIVSMLKSCVKALTYEEIKEYVNYTADYYSSNSNYQQIKQKVNSVDSSDINDINNMANGYNNVCIYKMDNNHFNIKVFNATKLTSDSSSIYYSGNYKTIQWSGSWGSVYGPYTETNSSIDGGYSYKSSTGQENSLWGMTLLGQTPTGQLPNTFVGDQGIPEPILLVIDTDAWGLANVNISGEAMKAFSFNYNLTSCMLANIEIPEGTLKLKMYLSGDSFYQEDVCDITELTQPHMWVHHGNTNNHFFINENNDNLILTLDTILIDYYKRYGFKIEAYARRRITSYCLRSIL